MTSPAKKAAKKAGATPARGGAGQAAGLAGLAGSDRARQIEVDDRRHARVTGDDQVLERHLQDRREQTEQDWHHTMQGIVPALVWTVVGLGSTVVLTVLYVAIVVALQRLLPTLTVEQDMWIAGTAIGTASGGSVLRLGGQLLTARFGRGRGQGGGPPAP